LLALRGDLSDSSSIAAFWRRRRIRKTHSGMNTAIGAIAKKIACAMLESDHSNESLNINAKMVLLTHEQMMLRMCQWWPRFLAHRRVFRREQYRN